MTESSAGSYRIYPNPAQSYLFLSGTDLADCTDWVATDAAGRRISLVVYPEGDAMKLDVGVLPDGLYMLEFRSNSGLARLKFVKN